jgi:hypothetical protein
MDMKLIIRSTFLLILGILVFGGGYYVILSGHMTNYLGAFLGFFPIMFGVYLIYRWERLYRLYQHRLFHQRLYRFQQQVHARWQAH